MLKGRDPRDAHHFVQRSCGVCTYIHALSSVRAVEAACSITIQDNARIIRNLLHGAQYQHDHIVHFYFPQVALARLWRSASGLKPPSFRRIRFQSAVKPAEL